MKKNASSQKYGRLVVKFGTTLLTGGSPHLNEERMAGLVLQVAALHEKKVDILMVSSGAVAAGRNRMGTINKVKGLPLRQVMAAVGQSRLMNVYERLFEPYGITIAQALLTRGDLCQRIGYLNARNTLLALLELGVVGIVNENDVVAVDELHEGRFGDNDNLSAMVANLVEADLLLILSDIPGLYTGDPHHDPAAKLIRMVENITPEIERMVGGTAGTQGTGGMVTKLEAARIATACGTTVVIASGREPDVILRVAAGESIGTCFLPGNGPLESRARWIMSGLGVRGTLVIDEGAAAALKKQKRSLLAAGVVEVRGSFERGDLIDVADITGNRLGSGISNYGSSDLLIIKGAHSDEIGGKLSHDYGPEVIHRNNLAVR